jgi:predicted lipoprotein
MRHFAWMAVLVPLLGIATPGYALDDARASKVMANAVDGYIRPAYADFHLKAAALANATDKLCASPTPEGAKAIETSFGDVVESWGRVEFIRLGPVLDKNRFERILFYPDRKSTGLKQVQALLEAKDPRALDAAALADRSVAIQGLGAYEYTFFADGGPEAVLADKNAFRCRYGLAVARNVEAIAGELEAAWNAPDGIAQDWKNPSKDNPVYRDSKEAVSALIGIEVHGLEMVRDQRIKHFYRGKGQKVLPRLAVYWRSGRTMAALKANVEGLSEFWQKAGMASLLDEDAQSLSDSAMFDLRSAAGALGKLEQPTAERLADAKYLSKLDFVEFNLKDAMTRIDGDVGSAIGLGAGFSFSDGD